MLTRTHELMIELYSSCLDSSKLHASHRYGIFSERLGFCINCPGAPLGLSNLTLYVCLLLRLGRWICNYFYVSLFILFIVYLSSLSLHLHLCNSKFSIESYLLEFLKNIVVSSPV